MTNMVGSTVIARELEHLIEIAVVQPAVPPDGKQRPAHYFFRGLRIKCIDQKGHVPIVFPLPGQDGLKTTDRYICDSVEVVELDAEIFP